MRPSLPSKRLSGPQHPGEEFASALAMENASRAFLDAVRKSMRLIRSAIGAATINPDLLTAAERIQYEGYLHREEANAAILGWPRTPWRSRRSCAARDTAAALSARCYAVSARTSSASGRVLWSCICHGLTNNGRPGNTMAPSCGDALRGRDFVAVLGLLASGHRAGVGWKKLTVR